MAAFADTRVEWQRGWVLPEGSLYLTHDAWLPEEEFCQLVGLEVVTLEQIQDLDCLMLIGEPGSGKSFALKQAAEKARLAAPPEDDVVLIDLGLPQDARDLRESVFNHPTVQRWQAGSGQLHLFLDALDEAKVQIRKVVSLLEHHLDALDMSRLVLRITCRTAERPQEFEAWLSRHFGDDRCRTLELAPLRLSEARKAAAAAGLDPRRFIESAIVAGVAPLAARPLTLRLLLRVYEAEGCFPDALAALYERALRAMAGESDPERRALRRLSETESIAVAARIAAATVLAGRDVVGGGVDGAVALEELAGGTEVDRLVAQPSPVPVDVASLQDVLNTALFTARTGGLGWAHRTFGEYLAAFWLAGEQLSDLQVADLLLVNDGTSRRVAPALRNVAGWLLTLRQGFQRYLEPADAIVLVHGDPASVAPEMRRQLLPALLDAIGDQEIERFVIRSLWRRLAYDGIAEDLHAALADSKQHQQARQAASDAIGELKLAELAPTLVDIALDPTETTTLRTSVLYALRDLGADVPLDRIRPLALHPQLGDPDDEIKGAALRLCWPHAMTAEELFAGLTPEKNEALLGTYVSFLRTECSPHLQSPGELLAGVRWALMVPREWHSTRDVTYLADIIVAKAWPLAATEEPIAEALADLVLLVAEHHQPVFATASSLRKDVPDSVLHDDGALEAITEILVARAAAGDLSHELLQRVVLRNLAAFATNLDGLIERWAAAETQAERDAWKVVVLGLARGTHAHALFEVRDRHPELYAHVAWRYEAVRVDSPEAEAMRQSWIVEEEALRLPAEAQIDPTHFAQQVAAEIAAFRAGDADAYWRMQYMLMVDDDGYVRNRERVDDLTGTPGWRRADQHVRDQIADGAREYVEQMGPEPSRWLGKPKVYWPAWAGYCALRLLWKERRPAFDDLDPAIWRRWASIIVAWPWTEGEDEDGFRHVAMVRVREAAPNIARSTVVTGFDEHLTPGAIASARKRLDDLWDESIEDALFAQLERPNLRNHEIVAVVGDLVAHGHSDALEWAKSRVSAEAICHAERNRLSLDLVATLAQHAPASGWEIVRDICTVNEEAGRLLLGRLADRSEPSWTSELEPAELGEMFALLHRFFPPGPESPEERSGAVTTRTEVSFWRGRILEQLVRAGSPEAVDVVMGLEDKFDEFGWIRRMRHRAQEELRRAVWLPPEPAEVVRLGSGDDARYVADPSALRRLVIQTLQAIADDMRGAFPLAPTLWNTAPHKLPKTENEISNALAHWLRNRVGGYRAVVNREVEINAVDGASGDRTDLLIQAVGPAGDALSVAIEVKGAWNEHLMTAMARQLADQYLKRDLTDQGIYLVIWFSGEEWDAHDDSQTRRRARATRRDPDELLALLTKQAVDVSRDKGVSISAMVVDGSLL